MATLSMIFFFFIFQATEGKAHVHDRSSLYNVLTVEELEANFTLVSYVVIENSGKCQRWKFQPAFFRHRQQLYSFNDFYHFVVNTAIRSNVQDSGIVEIYSSF